MSTWGFLIICTDGWVQLVLLHSFKVWITWFFISWFTHDGSIFLGALVRFGFSACLFFSAHCLFFLFLDPFFSSSTSGLLGLVLDLALGVALAFAVVVRFVFSFADAGGVSCWCIGFCCCFAFDFAAVFLPSPLIFVWEISSFFGSLLSSTLESRTCCCSMSFLEALVSLLLVWLCILASLELITGATASFDSFKVWASFLYRFILRLWQSGPLEDEAGIFGCFLFFLSFLRPFSFHGSAFSTAFLPLFFGGSCAFAAFFLLFSSFFCLLSSARFLFIRNCFRLVITSWSGMSMPSRPVASTCTGIKIQFKSNLKTHYIWWWNSVKCIFINLFESCFIMCWNLIYITI